MYIEDSKNIEKIKVEGPEAVELIKQSLVSSAQGWKGWDMRLFTLGNKGHSPRHSHPWPHINYIVKGQGILYLDGKEHKVEAGFVAYIPDLIEHQFLNSGEEDFSFICIIPEEGNK